MLRPHPVSLLSKAAQTAGVIETGLTDTYSNWHDFTVSLLFCPNDHFICGFFFGENGTYALSAQFMSNERAPVFNRILLVSHLFALSLISWVACTPRNAAY
jgi:hypothetical protein